VQLFQADDGLAVKELRQRVQASMSRERELLLDPNFFMALQERIPAVSQVLVELKQGLAQNEMTRFRYDVTLHLGAAAPALPAAQMQRLDWRKDALTMARIRHKLAEQQADIIEISRIPNARLAEEKKLLEQLAHFNGTVAELRDMARATAAEAVAPEIFHALTQSTPCTCSLHYGGKFHYTAVFQRKAPGQPLFRFVPERPALLPKPWRSYANNPSADLLDKIEFAATLRDFLQKQLPAYMLPSSFTVLEKLPLTPNGKIDRKALPEPDAQRRDKAYQTPRDTVELQLTQIWEELLQVHSVGIKDNFFELGGHSLLAVRLMAQIEQKFKQRIALTTLFHNSSIEEIARILRQQTERLPWSCLVPIQPSGKKPPLFCVHPAGGNVLCYLELARQLGPEQPFYAFQAFGLEADQEPVQHVAEMAKQYIEAMRAVQPHGPYQLMGWSFGGLVVFEMAGQLEAKGESVAFLGLLDAIAPHIIREILQEPEDDAQFFVDYFAEADAALSLEYLRRLSPDEQLAHVVEQGRKINIFPPDVDLMQTKRLIRVYKSNMSASLRFQAQTCGSRVTLFQAAERRPEDPALPPEHGWQEYAEQPVEVFKVPGKHHTMVNSPHVEALAKRMRTCLERAAEMAAILKHAA
jgi:thioesterase domain-containing protein/acyl carrier protein